MASKRTPRPADPLDPSADELESGDLTAKMRDYLADIYRLGDRARDISPDNDFIGTSAIAEIKDVSPPAVNRMVTRLRELGFLTHEPYKGIRLTADGEREALKQLRTQRIVECFLVSVMGFGWHDVKPEADRMAHALPEVITERMAEMAGRPKFCPHGEPIPERDGTLLPFHDHLLIHAPLNTMLTISRVRTRERDRLEYIAALGLIPGAQIEILHMAPFSGPIQLKSGKEFRIIGHNLGEMIKVL
ncbi:MAG: metal-dependent transcriptional regulator [Pleurocapsa minor GSE-CHR-MK-17-07R]|nr:metal-dependent transcriptional regulator [Pleurocapsa minor GSE-CHR-MK 17-07R]